MSRFIVPSKTPEMDAVGAWERLMSVPNIQMESDMCVGAFCGWKDARGEQVWFNCGEGCCLDDWTDKAEFASFHEGNVFRDVQ